MERQGYTSVAHGYAVDFRFDRIGVGHLGTWLNVDGTHYICSAPGYDGPLQGTYEATTVRLSDPYDWRAAGPGEAPGSYNHGGYGLSPARESAAHYVLWEMRTASVSDPTLNAAYDLVMSSLVEGEMNPDLPDFGDVIDGLPLDFVDDPTYATGQAEEVAQEIALRARNFRGPWTIAIDQVRLQGSGDLSALVAPAGQAEGVPGVSVLVQWRPATASTASSRTVTTGTDGKISVPDLIDLSQDMVVRVTVTDTPSDKVYLSTNTAGGTSAFPHRQSVIGLNAPGTTITHVVDIEADEPELRVEVDKETEGSSAYQSTEGTVLRLEVDYGSGWVVEVASWVVGADGSTSTETFVDPRRVRVTEVSAADGHVLDTTPHVFDVAGRTEPLTITLTNDVERGDIELEKLDATTGAACGCDGGRFSVHYDADDNGTTETDLGEHALNNSTFTIDDLLEGWYTITELEAPNGYTLPEPAERTQRIYVTAGETSTVTWQNSRPSVSTALWSRWLGQDDRARDAVTTSNIAADMAWSGVVRWYRFGLDHDIGAGECTADRLIHTTAIAGVGSVTVVADGPVPDAPNEQIGEQVTAVASITTADGASVTDACGVEAETYRRAVVNSDATAGAVPGDTGPTIDYVEIDVSIGVPGALGSTAYGPFSSPDPAVAVCDAEHAVFTSTTMTSGPGPVTVYLDTDDWVLNPDGSAFYVVENVWTSADGSWTTSDGCGVDPDEWIWLIGPQLGSEEMIKQAAVSTGERVGEPVDLIIANAPYGVWVEPSTVNERWLRCLPHGDLFAAGSDLCHGFALWDSLNEVPGWVRVDDNGSLPRLDDSRFTTMVWAYGFVTEESGNEFVLPVGTRYCIRELDDPPLGWASSPEVLCATVQREVGAPPVPHRDGHFVTTAAVTSTADDDRPIVAVLRELRDLLSFRIVKRHAETREPLGDAELMAFVQLGVAEPGYTPMIADECPPAPPDAPTMDGYCYWQTGITNTNGQVTFATPAGIRTCGIETKAPPGFMLNTQPVCSDGPLTIDLEPTDAVILLEDELPPPPRTGTNPTNATAIMIVGVGLSAAAAVVVLTRRRRCPVLLIVATLTAAGIATTDAFAPLEYAAGATASDAAPDIDVDSPAAAIGVPSEVVPRVRGATTHTVALSNPGAAGNTDRGEGAASGLVDAATPALVERAPSVRSTPDETWREGVVTIQLAADGPVWSVGDDGLNPAILRDGPGWLNLSEPVRDDGAGRVAIAGHRSTYGAPFADLDQLVIGDPITVTTPNGGAVTYIVADPETVWPTTALNGYGRTGPALITEPSPDATAALLYRTDWTQPDALVLITCDPAGSDTHRLILGAVPAAVAP